MCGRSGLTGPTVDRSDCAPRHRWRAMVEGAMVEGAMVEGAMAEGAMAEGGCSVGHRYPCMGVTTGMVADQTRNPAIAAYGCA